MTERQTLLLGSKKSLSDNETFTTTGFEKMLKLPNLLFQRQAENIGNIGSNNPSGNRDLHVDTTTKVSYQAFNSPIDTPTVTNQRVASSSIKNLLQRALAGTPALIIAILLNLFFGVSFGQVFFPTSWNFPDSVPRAIGVQVNNS